jgi:hypothetical protein
MLRDVLFNGNSFRGFTPTVARIVVMINCRPLSSPTTTSDILCHQRKNCSATKLSARTQCKLSQFNDTVLLRNHRASGYEKPKVLSGQCPLSLVKGNILYIDITYPTYNKLYYYGKISFHNIINKTNKYQ